MIQIGNMGSEQDLRDRLHEACLDVEFYTKRFHYAKQWYNKMRQGEMLKDAYLRKYSSMEDLGKTPDQIVEERTKDLKRRFPKIKILASYAGDFILSCKVRSIPQETLEEVSYILGSDSIEWRHH